MTDKEYEKAERRSYKDYQSSDLRKTLGTENEWLAHKFGFCDGYALGKQEKDAEPPKFKKGDRVKTKYNDEYTISAVEPITDKYMYSLVCDNKTWCGMHLESKLRKVDNK